MTSEDTGFSGPDPVATRLTAALADVDPFLTATPEDVADDLQRAFTTARTRDRYPTSHRPAGPGTFVTDYPDHATETAMSRVRPVLEAKDKEIARLREQVEKLVAAMASGDFVACHVGAADELEAGIVPAGIESDADDGFPQPDFSHRAYGVELDWIGEDGGMAAKGHVPDRRFVAACNHLARKDAGLTNLWDDRAATLADVLSDVKHLWAIPADPNPSGSDWAITWTNVTKDTPGAFPITVLIA